MQREQLIRLALADRAAGLADEDGNRPDPGQYVASWQRWLAADPAPSENARVKQLMRELEVA